MSRLSCLVVVASLLQAGLLSAQEMTVKGSVKEFDIDTGSITIRPKRKDATDDEMYGLLKKDIGVTTSSGEKIRLDAILPGHVVQLKIGESGYVESIVVQPPMFVATVVDLDPKGQRITLTHEQDKPKAMTLAADARITIEGRPVFLREVKPGSRMNVSASMDARTILGMNLVADPDGKLATKLWPRVKTSRLPGQRYYGVLTDVDPARNEIKLTGPKTKGVPKAMPLAKDALVQVYYHQVAIQSVPLNQVVKLASATVMWSDTEQATRILVEPPIVRGKVKALDGIGGELTVEIDGRDRTFALRRDIKIMSRTRVKRLADLEPMTPVSLILSLDREQLLAVDLYRE